MIKQIPRPKEISNNFICDHDIFYYDNINSLYIKKCTVWLYKKYFNLDGKEHRLNGFAYEQIHGPIQMNEFIINGIKYKTIIFANITNHLICNKCKTFCKQGCFY